MVIFIPMMLNSHVIKIFALVLLERSYICPYTLKKGYIYPYNIKSACPQHICRLHPVLNHIYSCIL